jgi:hypothetical protein
MNCLRSLGRWDRGFESHLRYECLVCVCIYSVFMLSCVKWRPCDELNTPPRTPTVCEKWLRNWIRDQGPEWAGRAIEKKNINWLPNISSATKETQVVDTILAVREIFLLSGSTHLYVYIVACRPAAKQLLRMKLYNSRYWVTATQTSMSARQQLETATDEQCFLCSPCRDVISSTVKCDSVESCSSWRRGEFGNPE